MKSTSCILPDLLNCYSVKSEDFQKASITLGQAFSQDPIWTRILQGEPEKFPLVFGVPLKYSLKYGKVYASNSELQGIAAWVGTPYVDMSLWRLLRSGALKIIMKLGMKLGKRILNVFSQIEKDRKDLMKSPYIYLYALGILPQEQGHGIGSKLVKDMLDNLPLKLPVYLDTETEDNVRFYQRLGFEVVKEVQVLPYNLPMWEMVNWRK